MPAEGLMRGGLLKRGGLLMRGGLSDVVNNTLRGVLVWLDCSLFVKIVIFDGMTHGKK
jgi:hypothetical protein